MSNIIQKLKVVLWKNCIIRKRHWLLTTFEILIPILIFLLLAYMQTLIPGFSRKTYINETEYHHAQPTEISSLEIFYVPNTTEINGFMDNVSEKLRIHSSRGFNNEEQMMTYITLQQQKHSTYNHIVGIIFEQFDVDSNQLKYRLKTELSPIFANRFPNSDPFVSSQKNMYFSSGFLSMQEAIDVTFIEIFGKTKIDKPITLQEMPYPPHYQFGELTTKFLDFVPFCAMIALIFIFPSVLKRVIEEKSTGIKELMKMVGLDAWMLWLGWYIHSMLTNIISITFIVIMLQVGLSEEATPIVAHSDPLLLWIFLFLYCSAGICFSFAVSTLFKRPTLGMNIGLLVWIVQLELARPVVGSDHFTSMCCLRFFIQLLPNACLLYGFHAFNEFEKKEIGLHWNNLYSKPNQFTPHPAAGCVFFMLILDCIFYLVITWYVDNAFPGQYGIARPWYFPFTKSYWFSNKVQDDLAVRPLAEKSCIEKVSGDYTIGIHVRDLYKRFGNKHAVQGLNLDVYNNEITVLLGHNGAGKTTTMHIITGMISPTSGQVLVNGYSIQNNMNKIRESLGLCPQHNLQFSDLNVLEHLMFFSMLKGARRDVALHESRDFLNRLNLIDKANKMPSELSGGMRRKLSLGMALVGKSKVLMLDEPTSGMDPEARREIWDFLLGIRGERTILITTHYMEEADILGDRIAIMHDGQLECCGTSMFLKKHYGTGYTLAVLVGANWNEEKLTKEVTDAVPNATVKASMAGCVTYILPTSDTAILTRLFQRLEQCKSDLGITNFGVSLTTLEDVFLKVGELADERHDKTNDSVSETDSSKHLLGDNDSLDSHKEKITSEYQLMGQHFIALLIKRCQYVRHKWIMFLIQVLIPLAMALFIMTVMHMNEQDNEPDVRNTLTLSQYSGAKVYYSTTPEMENLSKYLPNIVSKQDAKAVEVPSVSNSIIEDGLENLENYHRTLIAAVEFNGTDILNGMFGNWALHGPPIALNLITNALLQRATNSDSAHITVINNPWPSFSGSSAMSGIQVGAIIMWVFLFPVAFTIMFGFFVIFLQEERQTGVKHLQIMAGVSRILYWLVHYMFDLVVYFFVIMIIVIILSAFDHDGPFGNPSSASVIFSVFILYGFAALPFTYLFIYRPTPASSMNLLMTVQMIIGTIGSIVALVLENIPFVESARDGVRYTLLFVPNFAFSEAMCKFTIQATKIHIMRQASFNGSITCDSSLSYTDDDENSVCNNMSFYTGSFSLKSNMIFLAVHVFLWWFILLVIDSGILVKLFGKQVTKYRLKRCQEEILDKDVKEEKMRIASQIRDRANGYMTSTSDVLEVSNLRKWYGKFYAVRGLSFGVKSGECFGLLGVNGAGKTTTFKMLTGEIFPSTGCADIQGFLLDQEKSTYLKRIGYCPQFDALNMTLTGYEMLALFARLRGVSNSRIHSHVRKWIHKFGIRKYESIPCRAYSGGNRRKLSTALALIGDPPLVMLDEPTSGVDPVARRNLWDILAVLRKSGKSIVLTSHSMDECEALCDRLAIMVDGQLKCIGQVPYLKKRFGQGFTVMLKLRSYSSSGDMPDSSAPTSSIPTLKKFIEQKYVCTLKDEHTGMLLYHIGNPNVNLGQVFDFMENLKSQMGIVEDYTVSDTSLEQVFLSFAEQKSKPDNEPPVDRIAIV